MCNQEQERWNCLFKVTEYAVGWRWASQNLNSPWLGQEPRRHWAWRRGTDLERLCSWRKSSPSLSFSPFHGLGAPLKLHHQPLSFTPHCTYWQSKGSCLCFFYWKLARQLTVNLSNSLLICVCPTIMKTCSFIYLIAWWESRGFSFPFFSSCALKLCTLQGET